MRIWVKYEKRFLTSGPGLICIVSKYTTVGLRVILFGDNTLSTQTNAIIFAAVHKYIWDLNRFKVLW